MGAGGGAGEFGGAWGLGVQGCGADRGVLLLLLDGGSLRGDVQGAWRVEMCRDVGACRGVEACRGRGCWGN